MTGDVDLQPDEVLVLSTAGGHDRIYHTDGCQVVEHADRGQPLVRSRESLSPPWRECKYCSGEYDPGDCGRREATCPLCGEAVSHPAPHIRAEHGDGGDERC